MSKSKIIGLVVSILLVGAFAFCLTWTIINWDKVKDGIGGANLYTQEDLNEAYEDGYNTALTNEAEYAAVIDGYRDTVTNLNDQIALLTSQVSGLTATNNNHLQNISGLQGTIADLNGMITGYQTTQTANQNLINSLSAQVTNLQNQVNNLLAQISQNVNTITALNNTIAELENSVAYYEALLAAFQSETKVIATFHVNNATYNVQVIDKNTCVSVASPANTAYFEFIGWTVDGQTVINLATYPLNSNTTFIAKVINKYDVKFMYDGAQHGSQIVTQNGFASVTPPANTQYKTFVGWSLDGNTVIDLSTYPITYSTTFYGVISYSYDVTFKVNGDNYNTQIVTQNTAAAVPAAPALSDYVFLGWSTDGINVINVATYNITHTTTFFAVIQQKYTVTFKVDGANYDVQKIAPNNYAVVPANPSISNTTFKGWSINGTSTVNPATTAITGDTTFIALFECTVTFKADGATVNTQTVARNGYVSAPSNPTKTNFNFTGWTINGSTVVNVANTQITAHTTFTAKFAGVMDGTYNLVGAWNTGLVMGGMTVVDNVVTNLYVDHEKIGIVDNYNLSQYGYKKIYTFTDNIVFNSTTQQTIQKNTSMGAGIDVGYDIHWSLNKISTYWTGVYGLNNVNLEVDYNIGFSIAGLNLTSYSVSLIAVKV